MALQIEKPGKRIEYILKADRESSQPTKFFLRALTRDQVGEIGELANLNQIQAMKIAAIVGPSRAEKRALNEDEIERINEVAPMDAKAAGRLLKQHALAARYGIAEIVGLVDENGSPYALSGAEFAEIAPGEVLHEIGSVILENSRYSEVEIKK